MAKEIGKVGQGFFDASGNLKTAEALKKESNTSKTNSTEKAASSADSSDTFNSSTVTNAISAERARFTEQSNTKVSEVNVGSNQVDRGIAVVKDQLKAAKELKSAIKEDDTEKADAARSKLAVLAKERDALADEISTTNREAGPSVEKNLRVGNRSVGPAVTVPRAQLTKSSTSELQSTQDVNKLIDSVKGDLDGLKAQKQEFKSARSDLKEAIGAGRAEIDKVEEGSIRTISAAESKAELVASAIRVTPSIVDASKLNADVTRALTS